MICLLIWERGSREEEKRWHEGETSFGCRPNTPRPRIELESGVCPDGEPNLLVSRAMLQLTELPSQGSLSFGEGAFWKQMHDIVLL